MPDTAPPLTPFEQAMKMKTAITIRGGRIFDLLCPPPAGLDITDIAETLSRTPRFVARTRTRGGVWPYSVAQHSVLVHDLLWGANEDPMTCYAGLLHDAHEAYMGDVSTPMKNAVPEIRAFEAGLQHHVLLALGVPWPLPQAVHDADATAFRYEAGLLMDGTPDSWRHRPNALPPGAPTPAWNMAPTEAESAFLATFNDARYTTLVPAGVYR